VLSTTRLQVPLPSHVRLLQQKLNYQPSLVWDRPCILFFTSKACLIPLVAARPNLPTSRQPSSLSRRGPVPILTAEDLRIIQPR
jgi:hypothetical protein